MKPLLSSGKQKNGISDHRAFNRSDYLIRIIVRRITIFEYERGLRYYKGEFREIVQPGQYWYISLVSDIRKIDIRPCFVSVTGQEILSADGVSLKVSLAAKYEVTAPDIAVNKNQNYQEAFYLELQLALREIIGSAAIDDILEIRSELSEKIREKTEKRIEDIGLKLISVNIKDIMFPGKLKQIFAQVVSARKEGLAALERARGETAALRNLANVAKITEANPNLMQLRLIHSISESTGNTVVLNMPSQSAIIPIKAKEVETPESDKKN